MPLSSRPCSRLEVVRKIPAPLVISFDIDGTLTFGDPVGVIEPACVAWLKSRGHIVGGGSDRIAANQRDLWAAHGLAPDFMVEKHRLGEVAARFPGHGLVHIGDSDPDRLQARYNGFAFVDVMTLVAAHWADVERVEAHVVDHWDRRVGLHAPTFVRRHDF